MSQAQRLISNYGTDACVAVILKIHILAQWCTSAVRHLADKIDMAQCKRRNATDRAVNILSPKSGNKVRRWVLFCHVNAHD